MPVLHGRYKLRGGEAFEISKQSELTAILAEVAGREGTKDFGILALGLDSDPHGLEILTRNGEGALHFATRGARPEVYLSVGDEGEGTDHFKYKMHPLEPTSNYYDWAEHPLSALIPWEKVVEAALEFQETGERPTCVEWQLDPLRPPVSSEPKSENMRKLLALARKKREQRESAD